MFTPEEKLEITEYLNDMEENSSVYLGCDSVRFKKKGQWFARYTVAFIIHKGSKHGAKIFHTTDVERVFDKAPSKPRLRLMAEVRRVIDVYLQFEYDLMDIPTEIHIDINSKKEHNSNLVLKEAKGMVMGFTGLEAVEKPAAFAASFAGDRGCRGLLN